MERGSLCSAKRGGGSKGTFGHSGGGGEGAETTFEMVATTGGATLVTSTPRATLRAAGSLASAVTEASTSVDEPPSPAELNAMLAITLMLAAVT